MFLIISYQIYFLNLLDDDIVAADLLILITPPLEPFPFPFPNPSADLETVFNGYETDGDPITEPDIKSDWA